MPVERWVLIGLKDKAQSDALRAALVESGHRTTTVSTPKECEDLFRRRLFLCAFFDRNSFREIARSCSFPSLTYTVLVAGPKEAPKALALQDQGAVNDWIAAPVEKLSVSSVLTRARTFLRLSGELDAIKAAASQTIRDDATLLCVGSWAEAANRWIDQMKIRTQPILLSGEAGCGKRLLALLLHYSSPRATAPFAVVQCGSGDAESLEREIFGEIPPRDRPIRAAPTRSKLSLAADGTLLLDKAEKLPRRIQQRLARSLREEEFSPTGGGDRLPLRARLIFTVQETEAHVPWAKLFHRDLARLLKRSVLRIPPLRDRKKDFPFIVSAALERLGREHGARAPGVDEKAMDALTSHDWPGNIRELEGVLWAASLLSGKKWITRETLLPFLGIGREALAGEESALEEIIEQRLAVWFARFGVDHLKNVHDMVLQNVERPLLRLVLKQTRGSQVRAAEVLGINRNTLRRKLTEFGIQAGTA